tara:strand:+ start:548 stop:733 length:186 start_codon:yes stop_codon:yes gene_type:complete
MIDDFNCYGCTIEAEDMDEAMDKYHEVLEDCRFNYWEACEKFEAYCEDGNLDTHWYEVDDE